MQGMVPLKKQSKKKQREFWERQRGDWQGLCPVTRIVPSKKTYQRKKGRQLLRQERGWPDE